MHTLHVLVNRPHPTGTRGLPRSYDHVVTTSGKSPTEYRLLNEYRGLAGSSGLGLQPNAPGDYIAFLLLLERRNALMGMFRPRRDTSHYMQGTMVEVGRTRGALKYMQDVP